MKIVQVVLALLLCLYVGQAWQQGHDAFAVIPGLDMPFWLAIPIAAIYAVGSAADLLFRPSSGLASPVWSEK